VEFRVNKAMTNARAITAKEAKKSLSSCFAGGSSKHRKLFFGGTPKEADFQIKKKTGN